MIILEWFLASALAAPGFADSLHEAKPADSAASRGYPAAAFPARPPRLQARRFEDSWVGGRAAAPSAPAVQAQAPSHDNTPGRAGIYAATLPASRVSKNALRLVYTGDEVAMPGATEDGFKTLKLRTERFAATSASMGAATGLKVAPKRPGVYAQRWSPREALLADAYTSQAQSGSSGWPNISNGLVDARGREVLWEPGLEAASLQKFDPGARTTPCPKGGVGGAPCELLTELSDGTLIGTISPLVLDLNGDGIQTAERTVRFDLDGDNRFEFLTDLSTGDAVLVLDSDGDGVSGSTGRELVGNNTDLDGDGRRDGFQDGFDALDALVRKAVREGALPADAADDRLLDSRELARLEAAYGLKARVGGLRAAAVSLQTAGVAAIGLGAGPRAMRRDFDGRGNDLLGRDGARFVGRDGSASAYADLWFKAKPKTFQRVASLPLY